jgi:hypothetical protein
VAAVRRCAAGGHRARGRGERLRSSLGLPLAVITAGNTFGYIYVYICMDMYVWICMANNSIGCIMPLLVALCRHPGNSGTAFRGLIFSFIMKI